MPYTTPDELLARPGQCLRDHLGGVRANAVSLVPNTKTTPDGQSLESIGRVVASLHDIGKLTQWFQQYIHEHDRLEKPQRYKQHALVGACLTNQALYEMGMGEDVRLAGFYAVTKHHGVLPDFPSTHGKYSRQRQQNTERYELVGAQLKNIEDYTAEIADEILCEASNDQFGWDDVFVQNPEYYRDPYLPREFAPERPDQFYGLVERLWSLLTCADKLDAAGVSVDDAPPPLPAVDAIEFDTDASGLLAELNALRAEAREDVTGQLMQNAGEQSVYTLTLPTGFGKTFAGLQAALSLADVRDGRVIYALPYTTVIDQVNDEIVGMFDIPPDREYYTIHHHLADTRTRLDDAEEERVSDGSEALYGESWQAGLVLTTFVQLFESLAGPANTQSIKLPALQDSVIVVDEPQALTREWWHLVSRLTEILVNEYDATVIMMTATQPGIIAESNPTLDPTELASAPGRYFDFLERNERVRFTVDRSVQKLLGGDPQAAISHSDAAAQLADSVLDTDDRTALAVLNTVRSASTLYHESCAAVEDVGKTPVSLGAALRTYDIDEESQTHQAVQHGDEVLEETVTEFLQTVASTIDPTDAVLVAGVSAALRPIERTILLESIQRIVADGTATPVETMPLLVSSTQIVEAGVDVSFDRLFRDFAPIPSIVQAAGRCNRSFGGEVSEVTVWRVAGIDERPPPSNLYKRRGDLLRPARSALSTLISAHGGMIPEHEMVSTGVREYYHSLHESETATQETDRLAGYVDRAYGEKLREASLIDDGNPDVIVLTDDWDARLLREYIEARAEKNYARASSAFDRLKFLSASGESSVADDTIAFVRMETEVDPSELDIVELTVCDSRDSEIYTVPDGSGVRNTNR